MARIAIITNLHDEFPTRGYLMRRLAEHWKAAGHGVAINAGVGDWPGADVAVLHVDLSVTPDSFVRAASRYPAVVNGRACDIRKRVVSRSLVSRGDGWAGPVIVKTDFNSRGYPESRNREKEKAHGRVRDDAPITSMTCEYPIFESVDGVPEKFWSIPGLVVERFLPECDERGYWLRAWVFFGERERCTRYLGTGPIVKGANIVAREAAPVPDELRAERARLGFDFGKFDFVMHEGKAVLLDANRTPGAPPPDPANDASNASLARGIDSFLKK